MAERPDGRDVIDRVTKRLVDSGTKPDDAKRLATESMIRVDRKDGRK